MPLYLYGCDCGFEQEYMAAIEDRDKILFQCPECRKKLKRKVTTATLGASEHETKAILHNGRKVSGTWEK